jgi:putative thioredoxin
MKNIKTIGTAAVIVVALLVIFAIFAWGKTNNSSNNTTSNNTTTTQTSEPAETDSGVAGDLGPNVVALTAATFNSIVVAGSADKLVVAEAYAPWCPHCQYMGPIVLSVAKQLSGKVEFAKMNSDYQDPTVKANYNLAISKNMQGYPTFWFYKGGKQVYTFSGQETQAQLLSDVQKYE